MPRSNTTGGKFHKKGKKHRGVITNTDNKIEYAGANQVYALVKKKIGGSRLVLECSDGKERSGIIPGKFFKKIWMNVGDILLCELNTGGDDSMCYINHKYTSKDATILKSQGKIEFEIVNDLPEESNYKYIEDIETKANIQQKGTGNNTNNTNNSDNSTESSSEYSDDDLITVNPNRVTYNKSSISSKSSKSSKLNNFSESEEESNDSVDLNQL